MTRRTLSASKGANFLSCVRASSALVRANQLSAGGMGRGGALRRLLVLANGGVELGYAVCHASMAASWHHLTPPNVCERRAPANYHVLVSWKAVAGCSMNIACVDSASC